MKCRRVRKLLTAFEDGELSEEARQSVSEHLAECKHCRALAGEVREVFSWAAMWRERAPSPAFLTRVKARARAGEESSPATFGLQLWRTRPAIVGVVAACVVFLFGYLAGVNFSGRGPSVVKTVRAPGPPRVARPAVDSEQLVVGIQRIKMIFGSKLSEAAYAQLNDVQRALAAGGGAEAEAELAVVKNLQWAEELVREEKLAEARVVLASLEQSHPDHALAPYARMTKMLTTPQPRRAPELLRGLYAALLEDTVVNPTEFYNQLAGFQAQATEYAWGKIVESADRLNPLNVLDYIEDRLASGKRAL
ncbi:zf-HC2 domain-containing protein [bacterium]|nr:zf-HC2 domain-containing protein [bacterium]